MIRLQSFDKPELIEGAKRKVLIAQVYSTYPFSNKNLLSINAGASDGVSVGSVVTVDGNMLLGQVIEVSKSQSIVQTIFDKTWSLPVRIGISRYDGLLVGGQNPRITLIDKIKQIDQGDKVVAAKKEFPYGMEIGSIGSVRGDSAHSFIEADLELPYLPNDIKEVAILLN